MTDEQTRRHEKFLKANKGAVINFSLFQGNRIIYTQRSHKNSRMTEQNPYRAPQIKYNHTGRSWSGPGKEHAWGWLLYIVLDKTPSLEDGSVRFHLVEVLVIINVMAQLEMGQILADGSAPCKDLHVR